MLRSTVVDVDRVVEPDCLGAAKLLERSTYQAASVQAVSYGTVSAATFGAVAHASAEDANAQFARSLAAWRKCDGKAFVDPSGGTTFTHQITAVDETDGVLSAVVLISSNSPTGVPVQNQRALGVVQDCIVEATVPITDPPPSVGSERNRAVEVVKVMLGNAVTAQR